MSLFHLKQQVVPILTFEGGIVGGYILANWIEAGLGPFTFTSLQDGGHMQTSRHYSGNAGDIRTRHLFKDGKHFPSLIRFVERMRIELRPHGVDIVLHPEDDKPGQEKQPHLHYEFDPKPDEKRILWEYESA